MLRPFLAQSGVGTLLSVSKEAFSLRNALFAKCLDEANLVTYPLMDRCIYSCGSVLACQLLASNGHDVNACNDDLTLRYPLFYTENRDVFCEFLRLGARYDCVFEFGQARHLQWLLASGVISPADWRSRIDMVKLLSCEINSGSAKVVLGGKLSHYQHSNPGCCLSCHWW
jgi:hypothetical protein